MAITYLVLEDGTVYEGKSFGYNSDAFGEVVFSTEECGYQKSFTDPSYKDQIIVMTYPLIGNYRIHDSYFHSDRIQASAVVCREYCDEPADMYPGKTLGEFLCENKTPGISGVDTRDITLKIRNNGTMKGMIVSDRSAVASAVEKMKSCAIPSEGNQVADVTCKGIVEEDNGKDVTIAVIDCGEMEGTMKALRMRYNIVRFPYDTPADKILTYKLKEKAVQAAVVSNGPGNPAHESLKGTVATVREIATRMPVFGLGLGHQIIALTFGAKTFKMKFGHHGVNEPVAYGERTYITAQNHCFAVDAASLKGTGLVANQLNVNDKTVEGMKHEKLPVYSVQYLPEITEEPWETSFLFDMLGKMVKEGSN